jgi:outer membrane protein TolC
MENQYQVHPDNWSIIAGVNINLFAGGSTSSKVSMAKSDLLSLRLSREKQLDAVRLNVQASWLDRESSALKVEVAQAAVAQSAENLRLQRLRYQQGIGTSTEVVDAVTLMTTAETNVLKANFGVKRAEAALQYTMGRDLAATYGGN